MASQAPIALAIHPDTDWVDALRFANRLLRGGTRVLVMLQPGDAASDSSTLRRGSVVVPLSPVVDPGLVSSVDAGAIPALADDAGIRMVPLSAADAFVGAPISSLVVGLYGGGGAPFNQASILAACGFQIRFLSDSEIRAGLLDEVDVIIVPGGGFRAMLGQIEPLGEAGCRAIARFVERGGMYVGSCAGSYDCAIVPDDFVRSCPAQKHLQILNARVWNDSAIDFGGLQSPGVGVVKVKNERPDHPVMFGLPDEFEVVHYNGPIFEPLAEPRIEGASLATGLATFTGWSEPFTPSESFMGKTAPGDGTLLSRAVAARRYSAIAGYYGQGRVVAFGSHPEFGFDLPMVDWALPAQMLANAVVWQATAMTPKQRTPVSRNALTGEISVPAGSALRAIGPAAERVVEGVRRLRDQPMTSEPVWLTADYAMSFFGLAPEEIWEQSLSDIESMSRNLIEVAGQLADRATGLLETTHDDGHDLARQTVQQVERWALDERPVEWRQDGGYQGVLALLRTAARMCDAAVENWTIELGPPAGPYAYMDANPYHLVVGSYLAAVGCVASAVHLTRAMSAEIELSEHLARRMAAASPR